MVPVSLATARPDGDVIHQVQYGQTLWSIAIAYGVKIDNIKRLNNLGSNEVWTNQQLLIEKGATQPASTPEATPEPSPIKPTLLPTQTTKMTATQSLAAPETSSTPNPTLILFIALVVLIPGLIGWLILAESRSRKNIN
jgi:LysM repeat protein